MTSWGINLSLTFRHGRLERKELNKHFSSRRTDSFVERGNRGGSYHVPGVTISINFERYVYLQFSHGFNLWKQNRLSRPELTMMRIVNDITDREDWHVKINDFSTCQAWREETFPCYFPKRNDLWDWCVFELRKKASEFISSRSVFVLDSASRICKSDRFAGSDLFNELKLNTRSLDLSPWIFPLVFEVSPIRIDGRTITRDNFLDSMTVGAICPGSKWDLDRLNNGDPLYYSGKSQWLATDVRFCGQDGSATIISPINNLHAAQHKSIYTALEQLVSSLIDDWNQTLLYKALARGVSRIIPRPFQCTACSAGVFDYCSCPVDFRESNAWANDQESNTIPDAWHENRWNPILALDGRFSSSRRIYDEVSLRDGFKDRGLQIYVEISAIKLDSDGSVSTDSVHHLCWDLNGNRNERIVATSLVCLRQENIDPGSGGISFRTETKRNAWEHRPSRCEYSSPEAASGTSSARPASFVASNLPWSEEGERLPSFQELGTIKLAEGRVVTYPNTLQHKFEEPTLKEPWRPGSIQFMQIHLVDPHYVVCSTRFVPPQSLDWWEEAIDYQNICLQSRIPNELSRNIIEFLLVPEMWLKRKKKKVRGLENYWQTWPVSFDRDGKHDGKQRQLYQACQPPIRYESAMRRKQEALQRHESVMRAVNGPKMYGRPRAITVWVQSILRDPGPFDDGDARDRVSALAPDTVNAIEDSEEDTIADFDSPMTIDSSSGGEGSTDGDDEPDRGGGGENLNRFNNGEGSSSTNQADGGNDEAQGSGGAPGVAVAQVEDASEDSYGEDDYVDAVYGFTLAELAEIEAMGQSLPEELESLYDDAMSQADEMEADEREADGMEADETEQ